MKSEQIAIDKLKPNERNPRINDNAVDAVAHSIEAYGFNNPIITDGDLKIAAGHTRLKAAIKLGLKTVPVIRVPGLVGSKFTGYSIADNKTADIAEWNEGLLAELLWDLKQDDDFDMSSLGFEETELASILDDFIGEHDKEDEVPPVPEIAKTKLGDLYQLGDHRLLCGDATKKEDVVRLLDGAVPFMMVTDPPYGVNYNPQWRQDAAEAGHLAYGASRLGKVTHDDISDWLPAYELFSGSVIYLWHASASASAIQFAQDIMSLGFAIRNQIIWAKPAFAISRGHYHWQHEPCWYAVREGAKSYWCGDHSQSTIWQISNRISEHSNHGTQKPIECMACPIRNHGKKGDGIYDPFLGSGTTMIACEQLGRKCFGCEIEPRYVDVCVERWETFTGKKAVLL